MSGLAGAGLAMLANLGEMADKAISLRAVSIAAVVPASSL